MANLDKHVENIGKFGEKPIVCLNRFTGDSPEEINLVRQHCEETLRVPFALSNVFEEGGEGGLELARQVMRHAEKAASPFHPLYDWSDDVQAKIRNNFV